MTSGINFMLKKSVHKLKTVILLVLILSQLCSRGIYSSVTGYCTTGYVTANILTEPQSFKMQEPLTDVSYPRRVDS